MAADDYEVGYKKPPKEHQFKKGQSGNPKGRPRRPKTLVSVFNEVLDKKVTVTENGRPRKIPLIELALTQLVTGAAKGDAKAMQTTISMFDMLARHAKVFMPREKKSAPPQPQVRINLPDNGRDPELTRRLREAQAEAQQKYHAELQRKAGLHGPANDDWEKEVA